MLVYVDSSSVGACVHVCVCLGVCEERVNNGTCLEMCVWKFFCPFEVRCVCVLIIVLNSRYNVSMYFFTVP